MNKPRYELEKVKAQIQKHGCFFRVKKKSTLAVVEFFRLTGGDNMSIGEAEEFIISELLKLTEDDFYETKFLHKLEAYADIYGKIINGDPWYIKLFLEYEEFIEGEDVHQVSFHPPRDSFIVSSGTEIGEGETIYDDATNMWKLR
ncbi:MAG: hypothetical protein VXV96_14690 [Bdellovibrionota bacterium]|nr:hypothetical protein [Bdellovibrionota bacterium]